MLFNQLCYSVHFFGTEIKANSLNIILPVGISFYTFQRLSYTIDVYKRRLKPMQDFVAFATCLKRSFRQRGRNAIEKLGLAWRKPIR